MYFLKMFKHCKRYKVQKNSGLSLSYTIYINQWIHSCDIFSSIFWTIQSLSLNDNIRSNDASILLLIHFFKQENIFNQHRYVIFFFFRRNWYGPLKRLLWSSVKIIFIFWPCLWRTEIDILGPRIASMSQLRQCQVLNPLIHQGTPKYEVNFYIHQETKDFV